MTRGKTANYVRNITMEFSQRTIGNTVSLKHFPILKTFFIVVIWMT